MSLHTYMKHLAIASSGLFILYAQVILVKPAVAEPSREDSDSPPNQWIELDSPSAIEALKAIADTTLANFESIKTWECTCSISTHEHLSKEYVQGNLAQDFEDPTGLRQEFNYSSYIAIDTAKESYVWHKKTRKMSFFRSGNDEIFEIPNVRPTDGNYLSKSNEFISFNPNLDWPAFSVLPDHPEAQNKRAAFRRAPESRHRIKADLIDPREFYGFSRELKFWERLKSYVVASKDNSDLEWAEELRRSIKIFESDTPEGKWYRLTLRLNAPCGTGYLYSTSVWSPLYGYNAISYRLSSDKEEVNPVAIGSWKWQLVNGVFVPKKFSKRSYSDETGEIIWKQDATLKNNQTNSPISDEVFSYRGLGMEDNDIVLDHLSKEVLILEGNNLRKIADFGAKYQGTTIKTSSNQGVMIYSTIAVIAVLLVLILRRRITAD